MQAKDFKLVNDDLFISNGDFVIDFSDDQHVQDIINSFAGWWKNAPLVGVGIQYYLKSSGKEKELERLIRVQLQADGYQINLLNIDSDFGIKIDYTRIK